MKRLHWFLLTMTAALAVSACDYYAEDGDGYFDAAISVSLGTDTKAFADGTSVDRLYAGIYRHDGDKFVWVADNSASPAVISSANASVSFSGKLMRDNSYRIALWAQKNGAPYTIDWAASSTGGPSVIATSLGNANDDTRDAFYGWYDTGVVTSNIDLTGSPISLKRPFAQINVLVPNDNINNPSAPVSSSMTVANAPTNLNLTTGETSGVTDWSFSLSAIAEAAFGSYANTHKYAAMNYVLVDQSANGANYDISFSVVSGTQSVIDKTILGATLKANGRTNIVGNIFEAGTVSNLSLTFDEIKAATINPQVSSTNPDYRDINISSASGTWTANAAVLQLGLNYLQIRNKMGSHITSPEFSSAIKKVEITLTSEDVALADRTIHAVPPSTTLPTGKDSSGKDIVYSMTEWANEYGCVRTGAEKGATVTIDFPDGTNIKQFMLIVEGGATYIEQIDVHF